MRPVYHGLFWPIRRRHAGAGATIARRSLGMRNATLKPRSQSVGVAHMALRHAGPLRMPRHNPKTEVQNFRRRKIISRRTAVTAGTIADPRSP